MANLKKVFSLKQRLGLNINAKYVKNQAKLHDLSYFFWECTSSCNISCQHCGSDCQINHDIVEMPAEDYLSVMRKVADRYDVSKIMVVITGGEPLLRKDLDFVGAELKKMGYNWGMVSNGYAMTADRLKSLLNSGLRSITISLDGLEENHDWMRGRKGCFEKAVNAIKMIVAAPNLTYDVVTCVNQRNILQLDGLKKFLVKIGVKRWRLFMIDPIGRAAQNEELLLDSAQFKYVLDFIHATLSEGEIMCSFGCDGLLGAYETKVRNGFFFCHAGIHVASILANGDIGACPNINRGFVQGNIYKDDFIDVWENKFSDYRNREVFKTGICKTCELWKWCRGDGMHLHEPNNSEVLLCHFRKLHNIQ